MSFTRGIHAGDQTSIRLAQGLLGLAQGLDLATIAEGVETEGVADILREQGWQQGQGWLYGKAAPLSAA
jgi:sensor c-di-GMP phosphodiesterase-like protein